MLEVALCKVSDLQDGQMKEFMVEERKVLLVNEKGNFYAVGGKCTHYGASLATGAYANGRVRCPWHGACFNVKTGDIEDFPGLDSLPKFETKIDGDSVVLMADKTQLANAKRVKGMCSVGGAKDRGDGVVIVGGGAAALSCAETLRQEGYSGRIVMLTREDALSYDRTKLSKAPDSELSTLQLRTAEFFDEHGIEVCKKAEVISVSTVDNTVTLSSGDVITYSTLVLASGGRPRPLSCPGSDLNGIYYLRTPDDGKKLSLAVKDKDVVVIGSSFIGMELASFAWSSVSKKAKSVTVVCQSDAPFMALGREVGEAVRKLFESKGVIFKIHAGLISVEGEGGAVSHVLLTDDSNVPAQAVVVGIGVVPTTLDYLKGNSGIFTDKRGFVRVNATMQTNVSDVYACGDVTLFPLAFLNNKEVNVQHWQMALKQGRTAGLAIAGKPQPIDTIPFFWTGFFGKSIRYAGYGAGFDDVIVHGSLEDLKFVTYYLKQDKVIAVATLGRDPVCAVFAEVLRTGKAVTKDDVTNNPTDDWAPRLHT